jgi:hypothetical protein
MTEKIQVREIEWINDDVFIYRAWMGEMYCILCGWRFVDGDYVQDCNLYGYHHPDCEPAD